MGELVRNCRLCKLPMESSPFMLCLTCIEETEKVQSFFKKNPLVSMEEISRVTNVAYEKVEKMTRLGVEQKN